MYYIYIFLKTCLKYIDEDGFGLSEYFCSWKYEYEGRKL